MTFRMKDWAAKQILGIEVHKYEKNGNLWFSQHKVVEQTMMWFGVKGVKPINIPLAFQCKFFQDYVMFIRKKKLCLLYLCHYSRTFDVYNEMVVIKHLMCSWCCQWAHGKSKWSNKWVFWYFRGTSVTYNGWSDLVCGSDFASDMDKKRSTSSYCQDVRLTLFVSWFLVFLTTYHHVLP
jgi:hypothetical protein